MMATSQPRTWARTDDDEWDIVTGVGYTALVVAAWRAIHAGGPRPFVRDEYAKRFITASGDPYLSGLLASPPTSEDATTLPRLYGVQTRFFDEFFGSAAAGGIRQAVILAAGLDSRAYRLAWPDQTTVFEVDRAGVLEFKARVLAQQGVEPTARRKEVAADLREDWPSALKAAGFDSEKPSAWSVEGLLPYLPDAAQDALFSRIDHLCAAGSRLAVGALGSHCSPGQLQGLEASHPGINLSGDSDFSADFSALTYDNSLKPAEWLAEHGWTAVTVSTSPELQASYGRTAADVDVEVDRVLRSEYITATHDCR